MRIIHVRKWKQRKENNPGLMNNTTMATNNQKRLKRSKSKSKTKPIQQQQTGGNEKLAPYTKWKTVLSFLVIILSVGINYFMKENKPQINTKTTTPHNQHKTETSTGTEEDKKEDTKPKEEVVDEVKNTIILRDDSFEVLEVLHHDPKAFTQGLTFYDGFLYEGTGTHGASEIRKVDPANPSIVLQSHLLPTEYFGEGITYYTDREGNHRIIQLTWKEKTGFVYDANTLELIHTFEYQTTTGEGWGISFLEDTCEFVVSDGSHFLLFWDCQSLEEKRKVDVKHYQGHQAHNVNMINELEVIRLRDGRSAVLANVWFEDVILQINPTNGDVDKIYVFDSLHDANKKGNDVFNGISVADENDHSILYVTGKLWPTMYKIKIT